MPARLSPAEAELVDANRVAYLATVDAAGLPHVVPVSPALDGARIVFGTETATQKVRNLRGDPHLALAFDDYVEDWDELRQVIVWGQALLLERGPEFERCRGVLYEKFEQYEGQAPLEEGSSLMVDVRIDRVASSGV